MIEYRSVSFGYQGSESPVITRANFVVGAGEFALVCGPTGSGKSTLLKLVNGLAPHFTGGSLRGQILIDGVDVTGRKPHELAELVGFVNQQPEGSFVADTVVEELAYGLEQLGFGAAEMHQRIAKTAKLVGVADLLEQELGTLSGGQQQRVAIGAAMVAGQRVLVLDEPTSALDATTTAEIVALLSRLAREEGITVLLAEHRLERVLDEVDSVIVVNGDSSVVKSEPRTAFKDYRLLPPVVEYSKRIGLEPVALSIQEARDRSKPPTEFEALLASPKAEVTLRVEDLSVAYGKHLAVDAVTLEAKRGEVVAVMGANGSGKSSLLWAIQGSIKPTAGTVKHDGDLAMVPQRASDLLFLNTLSDELAEADSAAEKPGGATAELFLKLSNRTDPRQHPRDLSSGQQLALALSVQLVKGSEIVLMDEPTRGLDYEAKRHLGSAIDQLRAEGKTVLVASHDVEFVARLASRIYVLDAGKITHEGTAQGLLGHEGLLPTQVAQITKTPGFLLAEQIGGEHGN